MEAVNLAKIYVFLSRYEVIKTLPDRKVTQITLFFSNVVKQHITVTSSNPFKKNDHDFKAYKMTSDLQ